MATAVPLYRLRAPAVELPKERVEELLRLGIFEPAAESRMQDLAEPEAYVRFLAGTMALGSYYGRGEIAGCREAEADWLVSQKNAVRVSKVDVEASLEQARADERKRSAPEDLVLVRFLVSWAVHGSYYCRGEIAGFRGAQAKHVLEGRTTKGEAFVHRLLPEEVAALHAEIAARTKAAAAATPEAGGPPALVRFLISTATSGSYYNAGESAAFERKKAETLLAMRTLDGRPFAELVSGKATPPAPGEPPKIPSQVDVAGLTDRDPDGVAELEARQEKALERPPQDRMVSGRSGQRK